MKKTQDPESSYRAALKKAGLNVAEIMTRRKAQQKDLEATGPQLEASMADYWDARSSRKEAKGKKEE